MKIIYAALAALSLLLAGCGRPSVTGATLTQDDHMKVVKLGRSNSVVIIRLKAREMPTPKSCEDYDVLHASDTVIVEKSGRWTERHPGLEVYLNVKRDCVVRWNYTDERGNDKFLYVRTRAIREETPDGPLHTFESIQILPAKGE